MKRFKLLIMLLFVGIPVLRGQEDPFKQGWKPNMTKAEYEAWKRKNIEIARAGKASDEDLILVENLKGGVHFFPFTGKKFVHVLSKFCQKIHGEYEVTSTSPVTEMRPQSQITNGHGGEFNLSHSVVIGYIVTVRTLFDQKPESNPDK